MGDKTRNLLIRTASGAVLVALVFGATLYSKWSFGALLCFILLVSVLELFRLAEARGLKPMKAMGTVLSLGVFAMAFLVFIQNGKGVEITSARWFLILVMYVIVMTAATIACEIWRKEPAPLENVSVTLFASAYVALPLCLLFFIPQMMAGHWCPYMMLGYIVLVWSNDVFAYLFGITLGKHRMCPRISPKKSWEGFAGGVAMTVAAAALLGHAFSQDWKIWAGLGAVVAVSGVAGDLIESLFKRSADVKDSGNIMPGHGGMLDRFDALLVSVPFAFVYLMLCNL